MILCLREQQDALADAQYLQDMQISALAAPVIQIVSEDAEIPELADCQGLIYTSRYAINPVHTRLSQRAFCVGPGSAKHARANGFTEIITGTGGAEELMRQIAQTCQPEAGPLYWPHGRITATDIAEALGQTGFNVVDDIVYHLTPVAAFPDEVLRAITNGQVTSVMCMSVQHLIQFAKMLADTELWHHHKHWVLYAPSKRVADAVPAAWADCQIAKTANRQAVLDMIISRAEQSRM